LSNFQLHVLITIKKSMKGLVINVDNFLQFPTAPTKHDLGTTFEFLSKFPTSTPCPRPLIW